MDARCPYCAEAIDPALTVCPACGEHLTESTARQARGVNLPLLLGVVALVLFLLCGTVVLFLPLRMQPTRANKAKCANDLRQIVLAAIQYGDDHSNLPHVGPLGSLDGDITSSDTPRTMRALLWYGYHDNPEGWICPSSYDVSNPVDRKADLKAWFWDAQPSANPSASPFVDGQPDPPLNQTAELSYGWTRRGLSINTRSVTIVAADRALRLPDDAPQPSDALWGNHTDGWNVAHADGTVDLARKSASPDPAVTLIGTSDKNAHGFLPLKDEHAP